MRESDEGQEDVKRDAPSGFHETHPRLAELQARAKAADAQAMRNTLIRSALMARERRFTGESLPGFGRAS